MGDRTSFQAALPCGLTVEEEMAPAECPIQAEVAHTWDSIGFAAAVRGIDGVIAVRRTPFVFPLARTSNAVRGILYGIGRRKRNKRGEDGEG